MQTDYCINWPNCTDKIGFRWYIIIDKIIKPQPMTQLTMCKLSLKVSRSYELYEQYIYISFSLSCFISWDGIFCTSFTFYLSFFSLATFNLSLHHAFSFSLPNLFHLTIIIFRILALTLSSRDLINDFLPHSTSVLKKPRNSNQMFNNQVQSLIKILTVHLQCYQKKKEKNKNQNS